MTIKKFVAPALPGASPKYDEQRAAQLNYSLRLYFNNLDNFLLAISTPQNGATADRPTQNLQVGQFYFDTTLGYPVWWSGTYWVDALGHHPESVTVTGTTSRINIGAVLVTT
jgi:hypothetical protein